MSPLAHKTPVSVRGEINPRIMAGRACDRGTFRSEDGSILARCWTPRSALLSIAWILLCAPRGRNRREMAEWCSTGAVDFETDLFGVI